MKNSSGGSLCRWRGSTAGPTMPSRRLTGTRRPIFFGRRRCGCSRRRRSSALPSNPSTTPTLSRRLKKLARPSLGDWWGIVRRVVPILADADDAGFGAVRGLVLDRGRDDLPRAAPIVHPAHEFLERDGGSLMRVEGWIYDDNRRVFLDSLCWALGLGTSLDDDVWDAVSKALPVTDFDANRGLDFALGTTSERVDFALGTKTEGTMWMAIDPDGGGTWVRLDVPEDAGPQLRMAMFILGRYRIRDRPVR